MTVVVRPDLTEENLTQLLAEGHESECLDFKSECDLSVRDEVIELVKDIAAMQILGGYVVVGADDKGQPAGHLSDHHLRLFEQTSFRAKALKYLAEPLDLRWCHHVVEGHDYVLIYIGANRDGWAVIRVDGQNSKGEFVFRKGDVFARHGSASERWSQEDAERVKRNLLGREKDGWMQEVATVVANRIPSTEALAIARGPVRALTWELDSSTFTDVVVEQLRSGDMLPVRLLILGIRKDLGRVLRGDGDPTEIETILDRTACLAALMIQLKNDELFGAAIQGFVSAYGLAANSHGVTNFGMVISAAELWFAIIQRITALGALAVRLHRWDLVPVLVLQKGRGHDFEYRDYTNWYRHAHVMAARANLLVLEFQGRPTGANLLRFAQARIDRLECLRPDIEPDDDEILDSLCRFDFLAGLVALSAFGDERSGATYYPSFARFNGVRAENAVTELLDEPDQRQAIFKGSDRELAQTLRQIDDVARREAPLNSGWHGFEQDRVTQFIDANLRQP